MIVWRGSTAREEVPLPVKSRLQVRSTELNREH